MRPFARILLAFVLLTALFTGAVIAAFSIPRSAIEGNVRQSVGQVTGDGAMFTVAIGPFQPYKLGVFTDCLMLGIAYCADSDHPLTSAMNDRFMMQDGSPVKGARLMLEQPHDEALQPVVYSRYWHGNQVVLRPLLCVTTIHGIRVLNVVLLGLLMAWLLALMWKRLGKANALIITGGLAAVMIPSVPFCMNYVPTFYIALLACVTMLTWRRATASGSNAAVLFFVVGGLTAFFDLLTTPMVALAVPLTVYLLHCKPRHAWRMMVVMALSWLLGYASLWAAKWVLAYLVTGYAAIQDAMGAVAQRTVGRNEQAYMMWCLKATGAAFAATALLIALLIACTRKPRRQALARDGWMLVLGLSSFVWAFVLLEHTWHHIHFTWRTFAVLLIGLSLYMAHNVIQPSKPTT